eukprot:CAMPEP_0177757304 /NCGR_PEP_ID=MMETSP0491_2-20121128/3570_1 /TAXON_ID=63592 /ORGANISM="Tetraselmis chuii, Strain PLY429" /LENGTH=628 /DNA_ID=CAMNT_0019272943 /DNA_START=241 /DNA_END=2127 /DNA_ORIENTATION=+
MEKTDSGSLAPTRPRKELGFGEGVCTCAGCMRKAPPIREDSSVRIASLAVLYAQLRVQSSASSKGRNTSGRGSDATPPVPTDRDRDRATQLMTAVEQGNVARAEELLLLISCSSLRQEACTELILSAAQLGHAPVVNTLAKYGANLEITDEVRGGRPLMHAATNGHAAAATALLKNGADREARDWNGYTALMIAVFSDRSTTASALLENGAEVDAVDDKGRTSMCHAARYGSTDCIHVLAEHGADVFAIDEEGLSPLDISEQHSRMGAASALRKLEQRQRLQDKRLMRQKQDSQSSARQGAGVSKEQADMNMEALLRELEEAGHREEEKRAAKKAKKKQVKEKKKAEATPSEPDQCKKYASGGIKKSKSKKNAVDKDRRGGSSSRGGSCSSDTAASSASTGKAPAAEEPIKSPPAADIRETWAALLEEAVSCTDLPRLVELMEAIEALIEEVGAAGVSTKYGKKVLQKLAKVAPAKAQLSKAMAAKEVSIPELQAAVEGANAVRRHLPVGTVEAAEARLARLQTEKEEAKWARLKADLGVGPKAGGGGGGGVIKDVAPHPSLAALFSPVDTAIHHDNECIVCLADTKDAVLIPCGHICMCFACSQQVQASSNMCPICRAVIDHAFQVL